MYNLMKKWTAVLFAVCLSIVFSSAALAWEEGYVNSGPGAIQTDNASEADDSNHLPDGVSAGIFTLTGYCGCNKCSGGHMMTYSGTVPTAKHTISADLNVFPLGTKLRIGDVVYTVEDKGSAVNGNVLDIYYDTHEEALEVGTYTAEVFVVEEAPEAE